MHALVPAAIVSVVITLYLIATVIVVPHRAIWFRPIFESLAAAIATLILVGAAGRARARGESVITALRTATLE